MQYYHGHDKQRISTAVPGHRRNVSGQPIVGVNTGGFLTAKNSTSTRAITFEGGIFSNGKQSDATRLNSEVLSPQGIMSPVSSAAQIRITHPSRLQAGYNK
jgi:hypothetical protein